MTTPSEDEIDQFLTSWNSGPLLATRDSRYVHLQADNPVQGSGPRTKTRRINFLPSDLPNRGNQFNQRDIEIHRREQQAPPARAMPNDRYDPDRVFNKEKQRPFKYAAPFTLLTTVGLYPIRMSSFLIQMGYEPYLVKKERNFLGRQSYLLLNNWKYANYIRKVDGLVGCYRGFIPYALHELLFPIVRNQVSKWMALYINPKFVKDLRQLEIHPVLIDMVQRREMHRMGGGGDAADRERIAEAQRYDKQLIEDIHKEVHAVLVKYHSWSLCKDLVSGLVATTICYPLRIKIRPPLFQSMTYMAVSEFVGQDGIMTQGFFQGIRYVYQTQGVAGFYGGLVPRLIGESINICLLALINYSLRAHLCYLPTWISSGLKFSLSLLANAAAYPFHVVSVTMAVAQSGFRYGCPPYMPWFFIDWRKCWTHLTNANVVNRGSGIFCRYYTGPIAENGQIIPVVGVNVGPNFLETDNMEQTD